MEKMVRHNTAFDRMGKRYLPEGHALDIDRAFTSETVVTDINEWKDRTNKVDLKNYDTKDAQEPSVKEVLKKETGMTSGDEAMIEEPERFLNSGTRTRELIEGIKDKIVNFESFKKYMEEAFRGDDSLRYLVGKGNRGGNPSDDGFKAIFNTKEVQKWLKENTGDIGVRYLMKRYNIEHGRATNVWNRMNDNQRSNVLSRASGIRIVKSKITKEPVVRKQTIPKIKQTSRRGTSYERAKPTRWTQNEIRFIASRRRMPLPRILEEYNSFFRNKPRTISSIRNKIYRL